jgi:serine/threonine protein kinase
MLECSWIVATTKDMAAWMHDLCTGLGHMVLHAVIHRDIKPGNCMLSFMAGTSILKLCDFGQGAFLLMKGMEADKDLFTRPITTPLRQNPTTFRYAAPEVIDSANYSFACDIWACGVILWELMQDTICEVWGCRCTPNIHHLISLSQ